MSVNQKQDFDPKPGEVYELAYEGKTKKDIANAYDLDVAALNKHFEKNPALAEYFNKGRADYMDAIAGDLAPHIVEAFKMALKRGDIKALEIGMKNVLKFFDQQTQTTNNMLISPKFDFTKIAPEEQSKRLAEAKRAKEALIKADEDIIDAITT